MKIKVKCNKVKGQELVLRYEANCNTTCMCMLSQSFLIHIILLLINKNAVLIKIHVIILVYFGIQSEIFWYLIFKTF